jgi:hypothetical protein
MMAKLRDLLHGLFRVMELRTPKGPFEDDTEQSGWEILLPKKSKGVDQTGC